MSNMSAQVARKNFALTRTLPKTHVPGLPLAVAALPALATNENDLDLIDPDDIADDGDDFATAAQQLDV